MRLNTTIDHLKFLLFFLFCFLFGTSTNAQELSGISPKYGEMIHHDTVELRWNAHPDATDYDVTISQDPAFVSVVQLFPGVTGLNLTTSPLALGTYYWRVDANTPSGTVTGSIEIFSYYLPTVESGLSLWLAADSNLTMNSDTVVSWNDLSGNGNNFSQVLTSAQPQQTTSVTLNNRQVIKFDGSADFLDAGDVLDIGVNSRTSFVLAKGTGSIYAKFGSGSAPFNIHAHYNIGGTQGYEFAGTSYQAINIGTVPGFNIFTFTANRPANAARIHVNSTQQTSVPITGATSSYNFVNSNPIRLGKYTNSNPFFYNGEMAEIIFFDVALTDAARLNIENYLDYKYNDPMDLGEDIVITDRYCDTTLIATSGYTNLLWSTGETTPTIAVNQDGLYWVQGTDLFGYVHYDTIQVRYPQIPEPPTTGICSGSDVTWNADMGPGFTYLWSTAETTPSITISSAGPYDVEVFDSFGCSRNSGTYNFTIDNYSQTATLGNDTSLCSGNLIALQAGAAETVSYLWPDMSTGPTYAVDTSGAYFVEATNVNGCVLNDTIQITITGTAPTAFFTPADVCLGNTSVFTDASTTQMGNPLVLWNWDFGDTNTDNNQNTTHTYLGPGVYTVELYIEAQDGCGAYHQDTVNVFDVPVSSFSFNGYCSADSVYFTDESTNGDGTINQWSWDFGQPASGSNTSTLQYPAHLYDEVNTFTVTLQVTDDNGCSDMTSSAVAIDPSPQASFTVNDGCLDQSLDLTNNSTVPSPGIIVSYLWDFGDGTTSSSSNPSKNYSTYGDYDVSVTVTTSDGCIDSLSQPVSIHALPTPQFSASNACAGNYTEFNDLSAVVNSNIDSSRWIIDVFDTLYGSPVYFVFDTEGDHFIKLTTVSAFGCSKDTIKKVVVGPNVTASFTTLNAGMLVAGTDVIFDNTSQGADAYNWDLGDGTLSNDESPTHQYAESLLGNTVDVTLESVSTVWGCSDTVQQQFTIAEAELDLALTKIFVLENAGYYDLAVQMKNEGSARIEGVDLKVHLQNGTILLEHYPDTIYSGQTVIYTLNSKPSAFYSTQDDEEGYVCIKGTPFTSPALVETDLADNEICRNAEGEQPILVGPYPNPAIDQIELGVLLSKSGSVDLAIYDERGREVLSIYNNADLPAGYHISVIDLTPYEGAVYVIRMVSGDTVAVRKLVKK